MKIEKKSDYTLISSNENTFSDFYIAFVKSISDYIDEHLVIQISENLNSTIEEILLFLDIAQKQALKRKSFVVICKHIDIDAFPESFNIVPTLNEAEDVLEMEAIERDLGF